MSLFSTKIKVDLKAVLKQLPAGAFVHQVGWDADNSEVVILWECERFHSGLTVPIALPVEDLKMRRLPEGVRDLSKKQPISLPPKPDPEPPVPQPKPAAHVLIHNAKEFAKAKADGKKLEFWGLTSLWLPVGADHEYTDGFHYRERVEKKVVDAATVGA